MSCRDTNTNTSKFLARISPPETLVESRLESA